MKTFIAAILGIAAGAAGMYYFLDKKYHLVIKEDLVRECENVDDTLQEPESNTTESTKKEPPKPKTESRTAVKYQTAPKILVDYISDNEFAEGYDDPTGTLYEQYTYEWYPDNDVVINEDNEIVEHPDNIFGPDWRSHIGEYVTDVAYIRNHNMGADIELVKCVGAYGKE